MTTYRRLLLGQKSTSVLFFYLCLSLVPTGSGFGGDDPSTRQPPGLKFEVVSVRPLNEKEAQRWQSDVIPNPDVLVRYRLSVTDSYSFYSLETTVRPLGYMVSRKQGKIMWLWGKPGENPHSTSPGVENLWSGMKGAWILMPWGTAIEWQGAMDFTGDAGENHAFAIYVRHRDGDIPVEVISNFYVVPPKVTPHK